MTPEEEKTIEKEVRTIMMRWAPDLPEWDAMSKREKGSLFAEILKKHHVIWDSFSLKQKRWMMRQMGMARYTSVTGKDNPTGALVAYLFLATPKVGFGLLIAIAVIIAIVALANM